MALVRCPECGKEVSNMSGNCIQCGFPLSLIPEQQKIIIEKSDVEQKEKSVGQNGTSKHIKITVEPVEIQVKREETQKSVSSQNPKSNENQGIIILSEDKSIAKKSWNLSTDEMMLLEASQITIEGNNSFKWEWYISMTNQRFILSKINRLKASAYATLFGLAFGRALIKGIPDYEIPFEHIDTIGMDKNILVVGTKDKKEYRYTMINKREARKMEERVNGLFS